MRGVVAGVFFVGAGVVGGAVEAKGHSENQIYYHKETMIILLVIVLLFILPISVTLLLYSWLKRKGWKKTAFIFPSLFAVYCYGWYDAFYPSNSFYKNEFTHIIQGPIFERASVISKSSSYPDIHGDYSACVAIELPQNDFNNLFDKIRKDSAFSAITNHNSIIGSAELHNVLESVNNKSYLAQFQGDKLSYKRSSGAYVLISFLADHKTVIMYRVSS